MRFGVVRFPGSCDEVDALLAGRARRRGASCSGTATATCSGVDAVVVPGGFSYGDYLRAGAIARFSPVMEAVVEFARDGGPVLGICNGFQVLCEARPAARARCCRTTSLRFVCRQVDARGRERRHAVHARVRARASALSIPVKHTTGRYYAAGGRSTQLEANGQVVLRYAPGQQPERLAARHRRRRATRRATSSA